MAMNFLVLFSVIAIATAASIPLANDGITRMPSSIHSVPIAVEGRVGWVDDAIFGYIALPLGFKAAYIMYHIDVLACLFNADGCPFNTVYGLGATRDPHQKSSFDNSLTIAENAANPHHQESPFPFAVRALWNPYLNTPLIAGHNEIRNLNRPFAGSFIPYLNSISSSSHPSFVNGVGQHDKVLVPAGTVLDTTP